MASLDEDSATTTDRPALHRRVVEAFAAGWRRPHPHAWERPRVGSRAVPSWRGDVVPGAQAWRWRDPRLGEPRTVDLAGGTIRYHDRGAGPVLVFVHGYLVNANLWREVVPLLADGARCITPDWPLGAHTVAAEPKADLSPPGVARMIADLLDALDLTEVTLVGNDSGGAYAQIAAAAHPERLRSLVLNSCETPWCSWPPGPGGFGLLKAAAQIPATHRLLYQALRVEATWRWPNTYGRLAAQPVDRRVMHTYVRPVLHDGDIRRDGRKAIAGVSPRHLAPAAERLQRGFDRPVLCAWAADDRVFPVEHGRRYAHALGARWATIDGSYTYTAEDRPQRTAEVLADWLRRVH